MAIGSSLTYLISSLLTEAWGSISVEV
jgi:hypothetical protein